MNKKHDYVGPDFILPLPYDVPTIGEVKEGLTIKTSTWNIEALKKLVDKKNTTQ